jgi:pimeloyl-ACP methyl ester carboxylesterase
VAPWLALPPAGGRKPRHRLSSALAETGSTKGGVMLTTHETFGSSAAEFSINVADINIGYRIFGSGYPLLLIMGYGSTMNLWESGLISKLASQFKVIIFDNRGIGSSGIGTNEFSIEQFCEDTSEFMDALGIQQAHVLGWSMGSLVAQELVLRHPSKVNKLILYAAYCSAEMFPPSPNTVHLKFFLCYTAPTHTRRWRDGTDTCRAP